ncbi:uncharacterized protein CLAFUR5_03979 [Fulvia fulva]|uniref:Uncharacterized protein n=1 Tax=Passalora fulva TaxID=5499 RepID=A0A9Q8LF98_PASFU|nr:uncharacterized protein CLAFUR5_03979 [Fulvia fulva]KAK4627616.1 hypothetical protein CLAFUR0_04001 [Fulvia fulva]UJO16372.1 hypothetical protein CLAFUR5_03979 [Fulvia fulva]
MAPSRKRKGNTTAGGNNKRAKNAKRSDRSSVTMPSSPMLRTSTSTEQLLPPKLGTLPIEILEQIVEDMSLEDQVHFASAAIEGGYIHIVDTLIAINVEVILIILRQIGGFPQLPAFANEPLTISGCLMTIEGRTNMDRPSATSLAQLGITDLTATYSTLFQAIGTDPAQVDATTVYHPRQAEHTQLRRLRANDELVRYCQDGGKGRILLWPLRLFVDIDALPQVDDICRKCFARSPFGTRHYPFLYCDECLETRFEGNELIRFADVDHFMAPVKKDPTPTFARALDHPWLCLIGNKNTRRMPGQPGPGPWITRDHLPFLFRMRCNANLPEGVIGPVIKLECLLPSRAMDNALIKRYDACMICINNAQEVIGTQERALPLPPWHPVGHPRRVQRTSRGRIGVHDMVRMRGMRRKEWFEAAFEAAATSYDWWHATKQRRAAWNRARWSSVTRMDIEAIGRP